MSSYIFLFNDKIQRPLIMSKQNTINNFILSVYVKLKMKIRIRKTNFYLLIKIDVT